jgi:hypothetical protein
MSLLSQSFRVSGFVYSQPTIFILSGIKYQMLARSYNKVFFGHYTYRLVVEYKLLFDCVADMSRGLFNVFATFFLFDKW